MEQILSPLVEYIRIVLVFFFERTGNYGLAIILLSLLVNLVTFPLTRKQISASRRMQQLQPELKKLQDKYKHDKEKYNRATMEYMKENKINPLGGCLPLLVQLPIIIAVFQLLREGTTLIENTYFLGLDLQLSATEAAALFSFINPYYILPIVSTAATFLHQRLMITDPKQKMMLYIFPVMILVISVGFPAGLVLYWTTNSIFSVGNHFLIKGLEKEKGKKVGTGEAREAKKGEEMEKIEKGKENTAQAVTTKKKAVQGTAGKKSGLSKKEDMHVKSAPKRKNKKVKGKKKGAEKGR
ncbi:MAG: YidC/Oxa1 family membrane protein insertase [Bacillota bacterium]